MRQRGFSLVLALVLLCSVGACTLFGIKVAPAYLQHWVIEDVLDGVASEAELNNQTSPRDLRRALSSRFSVNSVRFVTAQDADFERNGNQTTMVLAYERRMPLAYNIEILLSFSAQRVVGQP